MISYEGLLQKLNKGNNFPASLPGWNKSGRNFRFSESCGIIKTKKKRFPRLFASLRKKCGKFAEKMRKKQAIFADKNPGFRNPVI